MSNVRHNDTINNDTIIRDRLRITIAGASGFIGQALLSQAPETWQLNALSRRQGRSSNGNISWHHADLFSLQSATEALKDTDVAIYLVHSMLPSTRLFQGSFADADLLIADNFVHSCVSNGVKHIIYLGGLIPEGKVSQHLASRREVEDVITAAQIPYTILRAGMVAGFGGSSFEMLRNLVTNLPGMILPKWTETKTQVIYIDDLIRIIRTAVMNPQFFNQTIDAVNGETLNYEALIRTTCEAMKKKPILIRVPLNSTQFSKLWVSIFGKSNYELASPLIDSLLCELPQGPPTPLIANLIRENSFSGMLEKILKSPLKETKREKAKLVHPNTVRSIQRLPSLPNHNCDQIAREYERWLPKMLLGIIRVDRNLQSGLVTFRLGGVDIPLLKLKSMPSGADIERAKFHIIGGTLAKRSDCGWLEFRQIAERRYTLVSVNEFVPTLPWYIYRFTQAPIHLWTMNSFAEHLRKKLKGKVVRCE